MRLLKYDEDDKITITNFLDDAIPPYTTLPQTWEAHTDEVTFVDLERCSGEAKSGYQKIRFCGKYLSFKR